MGVVCESCAMEIEQGASPLSYVAIPVERLLELSKRAGGVGEYNETLKTLESMPGIGGKKRVGEGLGKRFELG